MNNFKEKNRKDIPLKDTWNLKAMYKNDNCVLKDLEDGAKLSKKLLLMQGTITESPANLNKSLDIYFSAIRKIEKSYIYSHMKHDEDNSNPKYISLFDKAVSSFTLFNAESSFFIPEILETSYDIIQDYISKEKSLQKYEFLFDEIFQQKEHTLSNEQEYILSSLGEIINSSNDIFSILNDVDLNFGIIINESGEEEVLTHSTYSKFLESSSREVRKKAYYKLYNKYKELNNTITKIYSYNIKKDVISSKLRNYNSCIDAALSPLKIPQSVYENLINSVHDYIPYLRKYIQIKKEYLEIDDFRMYDIYTPIINPINKTFSFDEAINISCKALKPLGKKYVDELKDGLKNKRWVDVYENKGKTSGAFSFGSYDSFPYILMNFNGKLQDVFTLIHESGHSMHSLYTRNNQPYFYGDHSIFTAEVASTVNETLLIRYLLENARSKNEKIYLLNFYIDAFKSTLFRQTMFAEFEKIVHEKVESGDALTADYLNDLYNELNIFYYGDSVSNDDMIKYEWSRIPHFYNSFYVYQYATGYSAANAIVNLILKDDSNGAEKYIEFLKTGSSNYPIELLKIAGVDMSTRLPVTSALNTFKDLINEFECELKG